MTRLQPAYVADVAEAIGRIMQRTEAPPIFEFGGPCVYAYEEFLRAVARQAGVAMVARQTRSRKLNCQTPRAKFLRAVTCN
jgi:nucleoside-diphosphate-sugar epimerase